MTITLPVGAYFVCFENLFVKVSVTMYSNPNKLQDIRDHLFVRLSVQNVKRGIDALTLTGATLGARLSSVTVLDSTRNPRASGIFLILYGYALSMSNRYGHTAGS